MAGEHHEPLDFGVKPPFNVRTHILSTWEYLFPNDYVQLAVA